MARKRKSSLSSDQLLFSFDAPKPANEEAALAGLDRFIAASVARAMRDDARNRAELAGAISMLLAEDVTPYMLDAYASEARETHNIAAHRLFALIAVTDRFDILDTIARRIGASLLVGEEIITAQLGHIDRSIAALKTKRRELERKAQPINRGPR